MFLQSIELIGNISLAVISDPNDPKFDLEAFLIKVMADEAKASAP